MRVRSRVGSVAIAAVVIASTSSSSTAAPWKPTNATARKLAHDGASDFKRGDYEHAAEKLEAAWSVERTGNVAFALAQAQRKLGNWKRALDLYEIVLKDNDTPARYRELADAARDVVRAFQLAESLATSGEYADARRYYEGVLQVVDLPVDERDRATRGLADVARREAEAKAPHTETAPVANSSTDAHPTNAATSPPPPAPTSPASDTTRSSRWRDPLGWSFAGVGVVAAGVGAYLLADASSLDDQANAESNATTREQLHSSARTRRTVGTITAIGGGAFVILAVARFALVGPPSSSSTASIQLTPGPGDVGLGFAFDF